MSIDKIKLPDGSVFAVENWRDGFYTFAGQLRPAIGDYPCSRLMGAYDDVERFDSFVLNGLRIIGLAPPFKPEHVTIQISIGDGVFAFPAINFCELLRHSWWVAQPDGRPVKVMEREELPHLGVPLIWNRKTEALKVVVQQNQRFSLRELSVEPIDCDVLVLLTGKVRAVCP